jgi:hypothetical protein
MRFSQELARYEAEVYHVPGRENVVCDALSRNHPDISKAMADHKNRSVMSEKDTVEFLKKLSIPAGYHFTAEEVSDMLQASSLPAPVEASKPKKKPQHKPGKRIIKNMPKTLGEKNKKLPMTSNTRKDGVILPPKPKIARINATNVTQQDLTLLCQIASDGIVSAKCLAEAQKADEHWGEIYENLPEPYFLHDKILMYEYKKQDKALIALPSVLIKPLINAKHYSLFGMHHTRTRIRRDILNVYKVKKELLDQQLDAILASCASCQYNQNNPQPQSFQRFDNVTEPRTIWAIDIIPNMPTTEQGNSAMFVAIDMYTNYIQVLPIPNRSGPILKQAVIDGIIRPFGIPKYLRFDNEAGLENYAEFYKLCQALRIEALPSSAGAPWSNGAAERAVQTIKNNLRKFVTHEQQQDKWDEFIHFVPMAHNKSLSVYGYAPEELHFGKLLPDRSDLIELRPTGIGQREYMEYIADKANAARQAMRIEADKQNKRIMTYRNRNRSEKTFAVGDVVLKKQTQVSVGPHSAVRTKFTGPYHIDSIRPQNSSADIVHYQTGRTLHCHFSELQKLYHDQEYARLPESFDSTMLQMLPDQYSRARYLASQPFDTQRPTQTQPKTQHQQQPESQFDEDSVFGDEPHDDQLVIDEFADIPDDVPIYDFPDINIDDVDENNMLDLSHINLDDFRIDRKAKQASQQSQPTGPIPVEDEDAEIVPRKRRVQRQRDDVVIPATQLSQPDIDNDDEDQSTFGDSQLPTHSRISTDDVEVTIIRDPVANFTITEYKNIEHPMCVHVENLDPTQRVTELQVDPTVRPINVRVITEPAEGMIEDIPALQQPQRRRRRQRQPRQPSPPPQSDPYKRTYKTYARSGNQSRYDLRSKNIPAENNNTVIFYFKPP